MSEPLARSEDRFRPPAPWPAAITVIAAVLVVRLIYLVWLSPYELVGDEAYYWECSRHLSLCYYEKGPGLAWVIAACCRLFGDSEWAVRLPVALSSAAAAWVIGRLAIATAGGDARVGFAAVLFFVLIPAFQANAQICTQDGPTILFWALLTFSGLQSMRRWQREGSPSATDAILLAFLLGLAFLFKQSALLFVPGALLYALIQRRQLRWSPRLIGYAIAALLVFGLTISPMIIWNQQHGWPTLAHTLGHLGAPGGDHEPGKDDHFTLMWPLSLIGAQLGAVGVPALLAMGIACAWAWRTRRADPDRWPGRLWLICCSVPAVAFFVVLSFFKPVLGGWPFPSYVPLVALVAEMAVPELGRTRDGDRLTNRAFINIGKASVVYGLIGWLVLSFPNLLTALPVVGANFEKSVMKRLAGHRKNARQIQALIEANRDDHGRPPLVITRYYMDAALDAFYLPGHPNVYNAGTLTGQRPTSYDFWPANDLSSPALLGRNAILDGHSPTRPWEHVLRFESVVRVDDTNHFIGRGYGGLARHQP